MIQSAIDAPCASSRIVEQFRQAATSLWLSPNTRRNFGVTYDPQALHLVPVDPRLTGVGTIVYPRCQQGLCYTATYPPDGEHTAGFRTAYHARRVRTDETALGEYVAIAVDELGTRLGGNPPAVGCIRHVPDS